MPKHVKRTALTTNKAENKRTSKIRQSGNSMSLKALRSMIDGKLPKSKDK